MASSKAGSRCVGQLLRRSIAPQPGAPPRARTGGPAPAKLPQHSRIGQRAVPAPACAGHAAQSGHPGCAWRTVGINCRDSFTVHSTGALKSSPRRLNSFSESRSRTARYAPKQAPMQSAQHLISQLGKRGRRGHHVIGDACQPLNETGNQGLRVDQARPIANLPSSLTSTIPISVMRSAVAVAPVVSGQRKPSADETEQQTSLTLRDVRLSNPVTSLEKLFNACA